tara:strand:+ start:5772 stop:5966 length:195 start_codon:yes stop_codon:yes gene_type:complete
MGVRLVSKCCGDEWEDIENEYGDYLIVCIACGNYCETQNDYDYDDLIKDEQSELEDDERRDMGR